MGQLDQLAKRILREETGAATQERVAFEVPREVPVGALAPDGVVRVVRAEGLAGLPAPWCRLGVEATLDVKMPGDHTDRAALARNELPLRVEMLPFLVARSGAAQAEFLAWSVGVKGPAWTWDVVQKLPMAPEAADEFIYVPDDPEEQRKIKTRYARNWVNAYPEAADELLAAVRLKAEQELQQERLRAEQERLRAERERVAGLRHSVLAVLAARGLAISDALRARVEATDDLAVLDGWLVAAATASRAEDAVR